MEHRFNEVAKDCWNWLYWGFIISRFCSITSLGPKNIVHYVEVGQIEVPLYKLTRTIVLTKAVKINKQIKVIEKTSGSFPSVFCIWFEIRDLNRVRKLDPFKQFHFSLRALSDIASPYVQHSLPGCLCHRVFTLDNRKIVLITCIKWWRPAGKKKPQRGQTSLQ